MITFIEKMKNAVLNNMDITKEQAVRLYDSPLDELCNSANEIRSHFCSNKFDICTIINGKNGNCSENCKFCAQSAHFHTNIQEYPLLLQEEVVKQAIYNFKEGILRYSIVTSGKSLSDSEIYAMCEAVRQIKKETDISVCASFGLLNEEQYKRLKEAGVSRIHNNIETSERNFPNICTTHSFKDKLEAISAAQRAGLSVCSGGIMGLGETIEDRIDMAFTLKSLGIRSVPINILNPIKGTPFENNDRISIDEARRITAIYRFILPAASIRLAGGRGLLNDKGASCFLSGANSAISGDMLTTSGITIKTDMELIKSLGYEAMLCNE